MNTIIEKLRKKGYPYKILGNDNYPATLYGIQPLTNGDYIAIYRYPRGQAIHSLSDMKHFTIIEH